MKLLTKLEKSKTFWYMLGLSVIFFLLRLPSLIEPYWYGDEGIYQVIGQALNKGRLLYAQIWDNKPPLLYILYAAFHGDQFQVRLFSLITGIIITCLFFYLAQLLFKKLRISIISTCVFTFLFATPFLEGNIANAENFMMLPTLIAGIIIYKYNDLEVFESRRNKNFLINKKNFLILLTSGILLGLAFLFKIVAVFDFAAFFVFLFLCSISQTFSFSTSEIKKTFKKSLSFIIPLFAGFLLPISITTLYFLGMHAVSDFTKAVFFSNVGYVGYGNKLVIPQGLLILKLILLGSVLVFIFWKRREITKPAMFTIIWFSFSLFNTYFSGRPYTHYTLVILPSLCLLLTLALASINKRQRYLYSFVFFCSVILLNHTFKFNLNRTLSYYQNTISFLAGNKSALSFQTFFDRKTHRNYELSTFIKTHTDKKDNVFIWGDSAQIYALSNKLPPGKYTVAYHITQYKSGFSDTQSNINMSKPKYIVALSEAPPLPFYLPSYSSRFIFKDAFIYERNN